MVDNQQMTREVLDRGFNQGDLSVIDTHVAANGVDHQEPAGIDIRAHLKDVIVALRTAFPDLHFEMHRILSEGDTVAFHATMTGTHLGVLKLGPGPALPPTERKVTVQHMYFLRLVDGQCVDLWHTWDLAGMLRQLQASPVAAQRPA